MRNYIRPKHEEKGHEEKGDGKTAETQEHEASGSVAVPHREVDPTPQKKEATKPWEKSSDVPWAHNMLTLKNTRPGFSARWVTEAKIAQRETQGYQLASPKDYNLSADKNGRISRNELVLMEIPVELREKRRQAVAEFTERQTRSAKDQVKKAARDFERETGHKMALDDEGDDE